MKKYGEVMVGIAIGMWVCLFIHILTCPASTINPKPEKLKELYEQSIKH